MESPTSETKTTTTANVSKPTIYNAEPFKTQIAGGIGFALRSSSGAGRAFCVAHPL